MFFDAVSSEQLAALFRIGTNVLMESFDGDGEDAETGEVAAALLDGEDSGKVGSAWDRIDWKSVADAGIPALVQGAKQLNVLDVEFITTLVEQCTSLGIGGAKEIPAIDVMRLAQAVTELNDIGELLAAEGNWWAGLVGAAQTAA